jgi:hypothetical protein
MGPIGPQLGIVPFTPRWPKPSGKGHMRGCTVISRQVEGPGPPRLTFVLRCLQVTEQTVKFLAEHLSFPQPADAEQ